MEKKDLYCGTYVTDPSWVFGLEDEVPRQFGVMFEIIEWPDRNEYPYGVQAQIMAHECDSRYTTDEDSEYDKDDEIPQEVILADCYRYMGGINVTSILLDTYKKNHSMADLYESLDCRVEDEGFGEWIWFDDEDEAEKLIEEFCKVVNILGITIGMILDRQINAIGTTGWEFIEQQIDKDKDAFAGAMQRIKKHLYNHKASQADCKRGIEERWKLNRLLVRFE